MQFIANSKQQGLEAHLTSVANITQYLAENFLKGINTQSLNIIKKSAYMAGLLHDIGKADPSFQDYLHHKDTTYEPESGESASFSEINPLHHEISAALMGAFLSQIEICDFDLTQYAVYWHHAEMQRPKPSNEITTILKHYASDQNKLTQLLQNTEKTLTEVLRQDIKLDSDQVKVEFSRFSAPNFLELPLISSNTDLLTQEKDIHRVLDQNVQQQLVKFLVVTADRFVSNLEPDAMQEQPSLHLYESDNLLKDIMSYRDHQDLDPQRTQEQISAATELNVNDTSICQGPAGCGKTRVALFSYFLAVTEYQSAAKGMMWLCPRVAVCLSVLSELRENLPNSIVLLKTGEIEEAYKGSERIEITGMHEVDIVVTTVDQVAKTMTHHPDVTKFEQFITRYVVFDEYHELFQIQSLYFISLILMRLKEHQMKSHLFISATPELLHMKLVCKDNNPLYPIQISSFNKKEYGMTFIKEDCEPKFQTRTAYIYNTASKAQKHAMQAFLEQDQFLMCYHSKFNSQDKQLLNENVLKEFGRKTSNHEAMLYTGPIAQASLNISRQNLVTECSTPSNFVQRVGRCNRFSEYDQGHVQVLCKEKDLEYRKIQQSGSPKISFKGDQISTERFKTYYAKSSYEFYSALCQQYGIKGIELDTPISFTVDALNEFFYKWQFDEAQKPGALAQDTLEFFNDAIQYTSIKNLYKPTKQSTENTSGNKAIQVQFRGKSCWATMQKVTIDATEIQMGDWIGLPEQKDLLVSMDQQDLEYTSIRVADTLSQITSPEFNTLKQNIKYRARAQGSSIEKHLMLLASSERNPVIASYEKDQSTQNFYYLEVKNKASKSLTLGYYNCPKGTSTLKNDLQGTK